MASAADHVNEFKNLTLRDIRLYRDQIKEFLDTTYGTAENAVEKLFSGTNDPDVLKNLDEMNTLLKVCREKLVVVANSIPSNTTKIFLQNQCSAVTKTDGCIKKMSVDFNKQYSVKILAPGSPSRFWLYLESTSTEMIEGELEMFYRKCSPLIILPTPGVYVVCLHYEKYCRGKIITVEVNAVTSTVVVMLIDYGEIVTTTISKLYPMQIKFCQEPAYGLLCCVHNLEPANQNWNVDSIIFFNQLCENITASFHPPPKEHVNTEAFSIFFPDYYVSLQKINYKENTDIRLAMISEGMGTSSRPLETSQTLSNEILNSSLEPSPEEKSVKKMDLKPMASPYSSLKTNGAVENYVTPDSSVGKSSVMNHLVVDFSKFSATDPLNSKNSSLELRNQNVLQYRKKQSFPNAKAQEFISVKNSISIPSAIQQYSTNIQHNRPSEYENMMVVNQTSHSGSANVGKSSDSTDQAPKIRAVPLNGFTYSPVANHLDEVDDLFFIPHANRAEPISSYDSEQSSDPTLFDEPFPQPSDPQLLNNFLDCVNHAIPFHCESFVGNNEGDTTTFVAATSQTQLSGNLESFHGKFNPERELQKTPISLDYQYGSVLKPKPLPMVGNSGVETIQCYFSHIISPTHFYVHLLDDIFPMKSLSERLNQLYENSKEVPVTKPDVGSFWVVKEPQKLIWVRVKILSVDINDEIGWKIEGKTKTPTCTVFLVDWGDINVVAISQLRPLVKEILNIPCIAIRCRLDGIYPFERSKNLDDWSSQVTDTFMELANIEKEQTAFVSSTYLEKDGVISIILLKDGNENKYSVNELLVFLRCASSDVFQPPAQFKGTDDESEWDDPMYEDYFSPMNTPALDTENYDSVTTGYIPKDDKRICRFYAAKGSCYKGVKCDQLHSHPRKDAFTEDKIKVYVDVPSLPSLVSGSLIHIQVTCVSNAFRFYAILPYGTRNLQNISTDDDDETLESLQEALQKEYTSNYYTHRVTIVPPAGDVVIAKSPEDNRWYRGRVMEERKNDYFVIYFLDYGNAQLVHLRNLCYPLARFIHLPAQAMEMFLNGIDTSAAADTIHARNVLIELVKNRDLVARVVHTIPSVCVDLYNTDPFEIDIAKEMIRCKAISKGKKKLFCVYKRGEEVPG